MDMPNDTKKMELEIDRTRKLSEEEARDYDFQSPNDPPAMYNAMELEALIEACGYLRSQARAGEKFNGKAHKKLMETCFGAPQSNEITRLENLERDFHRAAEIIDDLALLAIQAWNVANADDTIPVAPLPPEEYGR